MVSYVEQVGTCQESFVVQVAKRSFAIERMDTGQSDEPRIPGDMRIGCWLINVQYLLRMRWWR